MTETEKHFAELAASIPEAQQGKMFGALCLKAPNGKAFLLSKNGNIAIKLSGEFLEEALALNGASIFEPSEGKKMNGWVQIPDEHQSRWKNFAESALAEVEKIGKKPSKSK
ncbi:hypothetical protein N0B40_07115 [Chryseobacterium oranimense]|uniref:hypothetical protein n=1 Tax=Chryseobacterium oranimense TaxID=421058 RepID=UPI0021AF5845|nr:hypothetical protein [Chryseobacterium oranimense]UWX62053.1 hypothetical protein N0B40_07115 [Chryseobacterium oranimense]